MCSVVLGWYEMPAEEAEASNIVMVIRRFWQKREEGRKKQKEGHSNETVSPKNQKSGQYRRETNSNVPPGASERIPGTAGRRSTSAAKRRRLHK
jgi:hypothetical protein